MKTKKPIASFITLALMLAGSAFFNSAAAEESEFSFVVRNTTRVKITKILVSENKKSWGLFDVGKGIDAGKTVTLVWDSSTNDENCDQWVKAAFADGSESEPAKFNFCEENLELEF